MVRGARESFDEYKKVNAEETERMQETGGTSNMHKVNWDVAVDKISG